MKFVNNTKFHINFGTDSENKNKESIISKFFGFNSKNENAGDFTAKEIGGATMDINIELTLEANVDELKELYREYRDDSEYTKKDLKAFVEYIGHSWKKAMSYIKGNLQSDITEIMQVANQIAKEKNEIDLDNKKSKFNKNLESYKLEKNQKFEIDKIDLEYELKEKELKKEDKKAEKTF